MGLGFWPSGVYEYASRACEEKKNMHKIGLDMVAEYVRLNDEYCYIADPEKEICNKNKHITKLQEEINELSKAMCIAKNTVYDLKQLVEFKNHIKEANNED
jgi:hypothetical protein